jgi:hypothetical protein
MIVASIYKITRNRTPVIQQVPKKGEAQNIASQNIKTSAHMYICGATLFYQTNKY